MDTPFVETLVVLAELARRQNIANHLDFGRAAQATTQNQGGVVASSSRSLSVATGPGGASSPCSMAPPPQWLAAAPPSVWTSPAATPMQPAVPMAVAANGEGLQPPKSGDLVGRFGYFFIFSARGRGRGSPRRQEGGGGQFFPWKSQEGGGSPRRGGPRGLQGVCGELGGGV